MSAPSSSPDLPALLRLRADLDGIDDAIHDLLMQRASVVEKLGALRAKGRTPIRPGREAAIIRRLLARHRGRFPPIALAHVWRELIGGMTAIQAPLVIAVCAPRTGSGFIALARNHFGSSATLHIHRSAAQAIGEVSAGHASAAVLPLPVEEEPEAGAWWTALLHKDEPRIHVTARLPFWPAVGEEFAGLVVSAEPPDPSGDDRTLIGLEADTEQSRGRLAQALATAGFSVGATVLRRDPHQPVARILVDVAGFVTEDDARLSALTSILRPPVVVGAYAVPIGVFQ